MRERALPIVGGRAGVPRPELLLGFGDADLGFEADVGTEADADRERGDLYAMTEHGGMRNMKAPGDLAHTVAVEQQTEDSSGGRMKACVHLSLVREVQFDM